jgi:hypothetical protein
MGADGAIILKLVSVSNVNSVYTEKQPTIINYIQNFHDLIALLKLYFNKLTF